jgi:hypothetical protein
VISIKIDFTDITSHLQDDADLNDEAAIDEAKKIALDLYSDLVTNTPVKTGRLRQGWTLDIHGPTMRVENQVPYAGVVMNDGHSGQAASGTLDTIIDRHTR